MSTKQKKAPRADRRQSVREFKQLAKSLAEQGFNVIAVLSRYDEKGAHFNTALALQGDEPQQDHALCDAVREISVAWSNTRHESQLVWQDPALEKPQPPCPKKPARSRNKA